VVDFSLDGFDAAFVRPLENAEVVLDPGRDVREGELDSTAGRCPDELVQERR
jgi:hypothetical protein